MKTRIRDLREDNDLSQQKVAEHLMCNQSLYSRYELEKNDIPAFLLTKLAVLYDTSIDYLMYLTDEKKPYPRRREKK